MSFCHSNIKFISYSHRVISAMHVSMLFVDDENLARNGRKVENRSKPQKTSRWGSFFTPNLLLNNLSNHHILQLKT